MALGREVKSQGRISGFWGCQEGAVLLGAPVMSLWSWVGLHSVGWSRKAGTTLPQVSRAASQSPTPPGQAAGAACLRVRGQRVGVKLAEARAVLPWAALPVLGLAPTLLLGAQTPAC